MKIQTKDFETYSDIDFFDDWGSLVTKNGVIIPISLIENWIEVYAEYAKNRLSCDSVIYDCNKNEISLFFRTQISPDYPLGEFEFIVETIGVFISIILSSEKISIYGVGYKIENNDNFIASFILNKVE